MTCLCYLFCVYRVSSPKLGLIEYEYSVGFSTVFVSNKKKKPIDSQRPP